MPRGRFLASVFGFLLLVSMLGPAGAQETPKTPPTPAPKGGTTTSSAPVKGMSGTIKSIGDGTMVVAGSHNQEITLLLDSESKVQKMAAHKTKPQPIAVKELAQGDRVNVHYVVSDGKHVVKSVVVQPSVPGKGAKHSEPTKTN